MEVNLKNEEQKLDFKPINIVLEIVIDNPTEYVNLLNDASMFKKDGNNIKDDGGEDYSDNLNGILKFILTQVVKASVVEKETDVKENVEK